jgi:hypothetical protein
MVRMPQPDSVLIAVIAAVPGTVGAWLAYQAATRQRRREARLESRKVDSEAFGRAEAIYKGAIDTLEEQVKDLQQRDREKARELRRVERRNAQLTRAIVELGGTVPPMEAMGSESGRTTTEGTGR